MLYEIKDVRQIKGEGKRRWFTSDNFDLIMWYGDDGSIDGFQLCYDKMGKERALTWRPGDRYSHMKIDSGELWPTFNKTPILVADGVFNKKLVLAQFQKESSIVDKNIKEFVSNKIKQYV